MEQWRLNLTAKAAIADPANDLSVSSISAWEIACKAHKASILGMSPLIAQGSSSFQRSLSLMGAALLDVSLDDLLLGARLPQIHKDPFDRILLGQALSGGFTFVTHDAIMLKYPGVSFLKA